jgi:hypothetical protein
MGLDNLGITQRSENVPDLGNIKVPTDFSGISLSSLTGNSQVKQVSSLPWQNVGSRFYPFIAIKPDRWDQLFPYRLLVIDTKKSNKIVNGTPTTQVTVTGGKDNAIVAFEPLGKQWVFTLPISPQQLSITDQYAINTTATLRGVLEEHNGVKFKLVSASGTMGVWPYRQSITQPPQSPTILQSIFGGTIEAFDNLLGQVNRVINAATTGHPSNKPTVKRPETSPQGATSTGFYQAQALQQFLEQYAEAKKNPANSGWRLIFDIPKQNTSYIVTPMPFVWQQSANKPMEVQYSMQFKAWRRIDLQEKISPTAPDIQSISPGILQRILSVLDEARSTTAAAVDLIGAVRSDVDKPLDVLRQSSLLVKDLAGVAITVADLPFQIQRDYASSIKQSMNILKDSISGNSSDPNVRAALAAVVASVALAEGLSLNAVAGGQLGNAAKVAQSIDPANNIFSQPERNFDLMNQVPVSSLTLTDAQQNAIDEVLNEARQITVDNLKSFRAVIQDLAFQLGNNFGAGDAYYNQIYGLPAPKTRIAPMTMDEYDILAKLYETVQAYDILTATTDIDDANRQTNMDYVAGLADLSGIPFTTTTSKVLAPVPFGLTIEEIALRYLGDAQRWLEIATLNNLRDPYIDENGFQLPLLSNATGRQITISTDENLYIGQRVILMSSTQTPSARLILDIERLSDTSFLITMDGAANLDNYTTADSAFLQAYLPGTVNSQQKIFIPSDLPAPADENVVIPSSTQSDPLVGLSKVDLLLTDKGDLAVNNYGDFRYAAGMTNIIQALKIKLSTPKGRLITNPEFGLGLKPGIMNSDITINEIYNSIHKLIEEDPRFQGLDSLQIRLNGPTMSINMGVMLAGQSGVFPVNFELPAVA